jgi:sugar phosphate permease
MPQPVMIKKLFYGWWIVISCFFIVFYVSGTVFFGFTAFFEPLVKEFGWSYTQVSFAASLRGWGLGIFAPLIGFLVDRFGPRKLIFWGMIVVGFGLILLSATRSLVMFYSSFLFLSIGAIGCMGVVLVAAVGNWFKKNVGKALGVVACGSGASGLLIPPIVRLIDLYDWRTTFIILGLGMLTLGVPLSLVIRNKPEQYGYLPDGADSPDPVRTLENPDGEVEISFKKVLHQKAFLYLMLIEVIRMMTATAVIIHVMPYLSSMGISRQIAGMTAAAIPIVGIAGTFGFGWLGDVFEKRYLLGIAIGLVSAGMLAFCYVQRDLFILIFLLLFAPGFGGGVVLVRVIQREYFGRGSFGKVLGLAMAAGGIGEIMGPILAGWVFDTLGSYYFIWFGFCLLNGLAIGLVLKIKRLF